MTDNQTIRRLEKGDLDQLYTYMLVDFPDNERKPLKMIKDSFDSGFMEGYGLYSETNDLLAYALFVKLGDVLLFDYLAVLPEYRESGIGSVFLQHLQEKLKGYECVIGEVENPDYCKDPAERETMERRMQFYVRNGVRDTGASAQVYGVEYRFFEVEAIGRHTPEEAMERIARFYHVYWNNEEAYNLHVKMHDVSESWC